MSFTPLGRAKLIEAIQSSKSHEKKSNEQPEEKKPIIQKKVKGPVRPLDSRLEEDGLAGELARKIKEVAVRFDKEKTNVESFQSKSLSIDTFKQCIKKILGLNLNQEEFDILIEIFETTTGESVNGSNFLVAFTKLGSIGKAQAAAEVRRSRKLIEDKKIENELTRSLNLEKKTEIPVSFDFDEEIERLTILKLNDAAKSYNSSQPSVSSLDAPLQASAIKISELRQILLRTIQFSLNPIEICVVIKYFFHEPLTVINGPLFLQLFISLGMEGRAKEKQSQIEKQKKLKQIQLEQLQKHQQSILEKLECDIDMNFSEVEEARVMEKINKAAELYDKSNPSALSLEAFNCTTITYGFFGEAIRKTFNLSLSPKELGALVVMYDRERTGVIHCRQFLLKFIQLGIDLRARTKAQLLEAKKAAQAKAALDAKKKEEDIEMKLHDLEGIHPTQASIESANTKIREAAIRYDKNSITSHSLTGLQTKFLKPGEFRDVVRRTFNLQLTKEETVGLRYEFDPEKTGLYNTSDFLSKFLRIGIEERAKINSEIIKNQKQEEYIKRINTSTSLSENLLENVSIDFDFNELDTEKAINKLSQVAINYDKTQPSAVSLQYFDIKYMSISQFMDACKRTFGILFKPKELGAIITKFDTSGLHQVESANFIHFFIRLGVEERTKLHSQLLQRTRQLEEEKKEIQIKRDAEMEAKLQSQVCTVFDSSDRKSAIKKLKQAAFLYDKNAPGAISLSGFSCASMTTGMLKEMLRKTFQLILSPREYGAILSYFKIDTSKVEMDPQAFLSDFLKLGINERNQRRKLHLDKVRQNTKVAETEAALKVEVALEKLDIQVDTEHCTEKDRQSALQKITYIAQRYDKTSAKAPSLKGFSGNLTSAQFKDMLRKTFGLFLSARECGALAKDFSEDNLGEIVLGEKFVLSFTQLGIDARKQAAIQRQELQRRAAIEAEEELKRKIDSERHKLILEVDFEFTSEDKESALKKLTSTARSFVNNNPGSTTIKGFEAAYLKPLEFKEMLKRIFQLTFTSKELGSLVAMYDQDRLLQVNCGQFLFHFFKLGTDERSKHRAVHLETQRQKAIFIRQESVRKKRLLEEAKEQYVDYDFTAEDEKSGFEKLTEVAALYDKNSPGAPSFDGFESAFLQPSEFKDVIKKTFKVLLTERELGAVVRYFDEDREGIVYCADFLQWFLKVSVTEKSKVQTSILSKRKELEESKARQDSERMAANWARLEGEIDFEFEPEHLENAFAKIAVAAKDYDPSRINLSAFEAGSLSPAIFRYSLKRVLNVTVSNKEAGALAKHFQKGSERAVDCAAFLVKFSTMTIAEKDKIRSTIRTQQRQREERKKEELTQPKKAVSAAKTALCFTIVLIDKALESFGLEEQNWYREELATAMQLSSKDMVEIVSLAAGSVIIETKVWCATTKIAETLSNQLTNSCNSTSSVTSTADILNSIKKRYGKISIQDISIIKPTMKSLFSNDEIDYSFSKEDFKIALDKLRESAAKYDKFSPIALPLNAFDCAYMPFPSFREQLKTVLNVLLTPKQLGALVRYFQEENCHSDDMINCRKFMSYFMKENKEGKAKALQDRLALARPATYVQDIESNTKLKSTQRQMIEKLIFSNEDKQSCLQKLRSIGNQLALNGATYTDRLQDIKTCLMTPTFVKDAMNKIFMVKFTFPEIGVLLDTINDSGLDQLDGSKLVKLLFKLARLETQVIMGEISSDLVTLECLNGTTALPMSVSRATRTANRKLHCIPTSGRSKDRAKTAQNWLFPSLSIYSSEYDTTSQQTANENDDMNSDFLPLVFPSQQQSYSSVMKIEDSYDKARNEVRQAMNRTAPLPVTRKDSNNPPLTRAQSALGLQTVLSASDMEGEDEGYWNDGPNSQLDTYNQKELSNDNRLYENDINAGNQLEKQQNKDILPEVLSPVNKITARSPVTEKKKMTSFNDSNDNIQRTSFKDNNMTKSESFVPYNNQFKYQENSQSMSSSASTRVTTALHGTRSKSRGGDPIGTYSQQVNTNNGGDTADLGRTTSHEFDSLLGDSILPANTGTSDGMSNDVSITAMNDECDNDVLVSKMESYMNNTTTIRDNNNSGFVNSPYDSLERQGLSNREERRVKGIVKGSRDQTAKNNRVKPTSKSVVVPTQPSASVCFFPALLIAPPMFKC